MSQDYGWWCGSCRTWLEPAQVTHSEHHDEQRGGCGGKVITRERHPAPQSFADLLDQARGAILQADGGERYDCLHELLDYAAQIGNMTDLWEADNGELTEYQRGLFEHAKSIPELICHVLCGLELDTQKEGQS